MWGESGLVANLTPLAFASARRRAVRSAMRRRSSFAATPSMARTSSAKSPVVSSTGSAIDRRPAPARCQLAQLKAAGCEKVFREKITGTTADRPQLRKLMAALGHGDVVIIPAVHRLSRDTTDLLVIARDMLGAGRGDCDRLAGDDRVERGGNGVMRCLDVGEAGRRHVVDGAHIDHSAAAVDHNHMRGWLRTLQILSGRAHLVEWFPM